MKIKNLPDCLLAVGVVAFIMIFGVMTLISGGDQILAAAGSDQTDAGPFTRVKAGITAIEREYNMVFYRKFDFVTLNGAMRKLMGSNFFPGSDANSDTVKLKDGLLAQLKTRLDVEECREPLEDIQAFLDERGIDLIFTYVHTKVLDPEAQLPLGATDRSNAIADRFIAMLEDMDIRYVDTRAVFKESGRPTTELYFKTDAHWTIPAAFEAYRALAGQLNATGKFDIGPEVLDAANYEIKTREKYFLGSDGRNAGVVYSGLDDFTTLIPTFDTRFSERSRRPEDGVWEARTGSFTEAVMYMEQLEPEPDQTYSINCYSAYGYNRAEAVITNERVDTGRVLFIKNSSGNPVMAFTALGVQKTIGVDRRVLADKTIAECIDEYQPDAVVIVYNFDFLKPDRLDIFNINEDLGLE